MKLSRNFLVMALVLAFVFGAVNMVAAHGHTSGPWYVDTSDYTGIDLGVNAQIYQVGNNDQASITQSGNNEAFIGQGYEFSLGAYGDSKYNEAHVAQLGEDNEAVVGQRGKDNFSYLNQKGDGNYAGTGQDGDDMFAYVKQDATDSFVRASQFGGEGSTVFAFQYGDLNRIRSRQDGDDHFAKVYQGSGSYFNYASLEQQGNDQTAFIYQGGSENGALVEQAGSDNWAKVRQHGDRNAATVDQNNANSMSALTLQFGNDNLASITQTN